MKITVAFVGILAQQRAGAVPVAMYKEFKLKTPRTLINSALLGDGPLDVSSLVLESNLSFPRITFNDLAFPQLVLPLDLLSFKNSRLNESAVSTFAVVPALRAQMECESAGPEGIHPYLTPNYTDDLRNHNPFEIWIDGENDCDIVGGGAATTRLETQHSTTWTGHLSLDLLHLEGYDVVAMIDVYPHDLSLVFAVLVTSHWAPFAPHDNDATVTDPTRRRRVVQDAISTHVLVALLGATLALFLTGWVSSPGTDVLPCGSTTIASVAALLAGGKVMSLLRPRFHWAYFTLLNLRTESDKKAAQPSRNSLANERKMPSLSGMCILAAAIPVKIPFWLLDLSKIILIIARKKRAYNVEAV
ncbi:hypothetical protein F5Y01DRAFT_319055 [Xylaria sp. FL0043]|nr:hypothetical protein F5Y01DRAFT_319055 [Xylaria sp. FL0043]